MEPDARPLQGEALAERCAPLARAHLTRAVSVTLFGSLARSEGDGRSDLDVLAVFDDASFEGALLPDEEMESIWAFEAAVREATGWAVETISVRSADACRGLALQVGLLPAAATEGFTLTGHPLRELVDHEVALDRSADRLHTLEHCASRLRQWSRSHAIYEEMHQGNPQRVSIEMTFLWEVGAAAAEVLLASRGCRRMGERRVEEGIETLKVLACTELALCGAGDALQRLHEAFLAFEDAEELSGERLEAARRDAAVLRACGGGAPTDGSGSQRRRGVPCLRRRRTQRSSLSRRQEGTLCTPSPPRISWTSMHTPSPVCPTPVGAR